MSQHLALLWFTSARDRLLCLSRTAAIRIHPVSILIPAKKVVGGGLCLLCGFPSPHNLGSFCTNNVSMDSAQGHPEAVHHHRSHFGSRYTLGCCAGTGILSSCAGVQTLLHTFPTEKRRAETAKVSLTSSRSYW